MTNFIRLIAEASRHDDETFSDEKYEDLPNGGVKYTGRGQIIYWKTKHGAIRHRLDGPAFIDKVNQREEWWVDGKLHRDNGPAVIDKKQKTKRWFRNGLLHRENGPAIVNGMYNTEEWYQNGEFHREGGPAYIDKDDGYRAWWLHGQRHRLDGPAIEDKEDGNSYWVSGREFTKSEFEKHFGGD